MWLPTDTASRHWYYIRMQFGSTQSCPLWGFLDKPQIKSQKRDSHTCHILPWGEASLSTVFKSWRLFTPPGFAVDDPFAQRLPRAFCCMCIREGFFFFPEGLYSFTWSGDVKISVCEKATLANALSAPIPKVTFNRAWLCRISKKKKHILHPFQFVGDLTCLRSEKLQQAGSVLAC